MEIDKKKSYKRLWLFCDELDNVFLFSPCKTTALTLSILLSFLNYSILKSSENCSPRSEGSLVEMEFFHATRPLLSFWSASYGPKGKQSFLPWAHNQLANEFVLLNSKHCCSTFLQKLMYSIMVIESGRPLQIQPNFPTKKKIQPNFYAPLGP